MGAAAAAEVQVLVVFHRNRVVAQLVFWKGDLEAFLAVAAQPL